MRSTLKVLLFLAFCVCGIAPATAADLAGLRVLGENYPRAFFFRSSEGTAANTRVSYDRWDACFSRLMGIEGKVLDEEVPGRSARNIEFFTRFKKEHQEQLVLLHCNGNARDPRYQTEKYFAGHWLYYNGATILADVPPEEGETEIRVIDPSLFRVNVGRYRDANEDVGLCMLGDDGHPDWARSEQVQLVAVDRKSKTIRVRRGCYGTGPRAFPGGKGYAAAHMTEGPWGRRSHLMWFYNYSTRCPRDAQGRTCADVHSEELAARFRPGGELAAFDGLEFDVLHWSAGGGGRSRGADCDADGKIDRGIFDGVNQYGIGVVEFCRALRNKLGPGRLILADGMSLGNQRAFEILNGIESEGWPHLRDWEARDWSGGLNRHFYWQQRAHPPVFNYINHKFVAPSEKPGVVVRPQVPFNIHRLVFAAAVFTDSAVCYSFTPPKEPDELIGIWDELRMGTENRPGWLGRPLGPAARPAEKRPDVLKGAFNPAGGQILKRLDGENIDFALENGSLKIISTDPKPSELRFRLRGVPCDGPDLVVKVTAQAEPMKGYPREVARLTWLGVAGQPARTESARYMTWLGDKEFISWFYFSDVQSETVDLELTVEGSEPVSIKSISAHAHPDAIYREFERGLVLANPAPRPYTFDLEALFPGRHYCRLKGSTRQDPKTNNGNATRGKLTLAPKDALFLVREQQP